MLYSRPFPVGLYICSTMLGRAAARVVDAVILTSACSHMPSRLPSTFGQGHRESRRHETPSFRVIRDQEADLL